MARLENHRTGNGLTEDRFHPLVEHSPDVICVFQDGRLVYTTPRRCAGWAPRPAMS